MPDFLKSLCRWDPFRLMAQAAVAAVATYFLAFALGISEISWAIISALFVVQASVGSTLGKAAGRLLGSVLGVAIGLVCIYTIGVGYPHIVFSLGLAVAAMSFLSGLRPELNYGLVTVAIIILAPGGDPVETAWAKTIGISLGTVVGALAAGFILPLKAHRSADAHLGNVVRRCRDLFEGSIGALTGKGEVDPRLIHAEIRGELGAAETMASQSKFRRFHPHASRPFPDTLILAVQRLWHTLVMLDRVDDRTLADGPRKVLSGALEEAGKATSAYLGELAEAIAACTAPRPPTKVRERIDKVTDALDEIRRTGATAGIDDDGTERVFTLSFALQQLSQNIEHLADILGTRTEDSGDGNGKT